MNNISTVAYIAFIIIAATAGVILIIKTSAKNRKPTPLAGLAFLLVIAGILFGEEPWWSFSLLGLGVVMVLFDIFRNNKLKRKKFY